MTWFDRDKTRQAEQEAEAAKARQEADAKTNQTIEAIQRNIQDMNTRMDRLFERGFSQQNPQPAQQAPNPPQIAVDFSGLPDPAEDPESYNKALSERVNKALQTGQQMIVSQMETQQNNQQSAQGRVDALWNRFSEQYPDLMKHPKSSEWVEFAAVKAAEDAKARGMNVQDYMFGAGSTYLDDVAKNVKAVFGPLIEAGAAKPGGDETPGEGTPAKAEFDNKEKDEPALEPAAVLSGQRSPAGVPNGKAEDEGAGSLGADLNEVQKHDGYY